MTTVCPKRMQIKKKTSCKAYTLLDYMALTKTLSELLNIIITHPPFVYFHGGLGKFVDSDHYKDVLDICINIEKI